MPEESKPEAKMADNEWPVQPPADVPFYFDDNFIVQVREQLIELYLSNNNNTLDSAPATNSVTLTSGRFSAASTATNDSLIADQISQNGSEDGSSDEETDEKKNDIGMDRLSIAGSSATGSSDEDESEDDDETELNSKLPYHTNDIRRLRDVEDNWFLRRFLAWRPTTVHEATDAIHKALIWRKKIKLHCW